MRELVRIHDLCPVISFHVSSAHKLAKWWTILEKPCRRRSALIGLVARCYVLIANTNPVVRICTRHCTGNTSNYKMLTKTRMNDVAYRFLLRFAKSLHDRWLLGAVNLLHFSMHL